MFMSPIDTSALDAGASTTSTKGNSNTDPSAAQDRFLKLLVAQLNNQDPMNPLDNAQMTSQIAQINTVTGIQQLNLTMVSMAEQFASMQAMQGTMLLGRSVQVAGDSLAVEKAEDGSVTGKGETVVAGDLITTRIETNGKDASGKAHTMQADTQMKYLGSDCGSVKPLDQQMKAMQSQAPAKALAAPRAPAK